MNIVPYAPSDLVERAWRFKPRCLSELDATPMRIPPESVEVFDESGCFSLACRCGSRRLKLLGHPHPEAGMLCPLDVECIDCQRHVPLFDVESHGYDAELGLGCFSMRAIGQREAFACARCSGKTFELYVSVSYQIDPIEDWEPGDQARIQDLFDGFRVDACCDGCGLFSAPVSYECA